MPVPCAAEKARSLDDDHIITSFCPETAPGVAFKLLELMTDESTSHTVAEAMGFSLQ